MMKGNHALFILWNPVSAVKLNLINYTFPRNKNTETYTVLLQCFDRFTTLSTGNTHSLGETVNPVEIHALRAAYDLISTFNLPPFVTTAMPPSEKKRNSIKTQICCY